MSHPRVVSRAEWLEARKDLLEREKEVTRARDDIARARQDMPWVKVEKDYVFEGPQGPAKLIDLFQGRQQLIVRHFMFAPGASEGCIGCSMQTDSLGELAHLNNRDTTLVLVARAPLAETVAFRERMGWMHIPWYSSFGSDFNHDYEVTSENGESPGVSTFIREGEDVYHTYSIYDRGGDIFKNFYNYLELTPLGRQEAQLAHPWDWWRHKDRYGDSDVPTAGVNFWNGTRFKN